MTKLREAVEGHDVVAHTIWASAWTAVLLVLAVTVRHEQPHAAWALVVPGLVGLHHLLFRTGRWASRRGATNSMTSRATRMAWVLPVVFPAAAVWEALAG